MVLQRKRPGDRVTVADWNTVVDHINKQPIAALNTLQRGNFYGQSTTEIPVFSVFTVDGVGSPNRNEAPTLTIKTPDSIHPLQLFTNSTKIAANANGSIEPIGTSNPVKVRVTGSGFVVGEECGPTKDALTVQSASFGLVCLTPKFTEESGDYIWVVRSTGCIVECRTPSGGITPESSGTCKLVLYDGTVSTTTFECENITDGDIAGDAKALASRIGSKMKITTASCASA